MNDKYYSNFANRKNLHNQAEEYSDNFGVEDDEFTDETITSDDIRMIGSNKPSNPANNYTSYNKSPFNNADKKSEMLGSKYDVNNPSYRISGGFNALNKPSSLGNSEFKSSSMYGGLHSISNSNKAYDPYSNININANFSSAGFKSDRGDKYNIDIDMKKYVEKDKDKKDSNFSLSNNNNNNNNKNKNKDTNFNYNYNLNSYNSNLNYTNLKKDDPAAGSSNNIAGSNFPEKSKKKKKDFFDDLDNQLNKDKLNEDYDEFGIQLQDRENDHINIKSGEDDSDDLKEITNINKELESFSNSKEINEGSLRHKSKYVGNNNLNSFKNEKVSEEENNDRSRDSSSINENLYNIKKKQNEKNNLKLEKNESEDDYGKDNYEDNYNNENYENDFDDDLNSYKNSAKEEKNVSKKTPNMETNEDYRDSTISINAYIENEKKSENKYSNLNNDDENIKAKEKSNRNRKDINVTESNDFENNIDSTLKSKKEEFDYDKFTLSQSQSKDFNKQTFNPNADGNKLGVNDPSKMEDYLKKSQAMNFHSSDRDENKDKHNNNNNNNLNISSSKDLTKNKNQNNDKSSYNYSQELFLSQEKKSEKNFNKEPDLESEYNHFDDFDSNLESNHNDSSPYKIASAPNTNRENNNNNNINLKESKGKSNYLKTSKSEFDKSIEDSVLRTESKVSALEKEKSFEAYEKNLNDKMAKNNSNYLSHENANTAKNNLSNIVNTNKTIEEKSEKSSDILDSKENEKYHYNELLNYNSTAEFNKFKNNNNNNNSANTKNNTVNLGSEELIRKIIAKEMSKYISENDLNKNQIIHQAKNNNFNYQYISEKDDKANVNKARSEILNKIVMIERTNNFLLNEDNSKIQILQKAEKFFKLSASNSMEFTLYGNGLSRKDIREMKLDSALTEERKKREFFEFNFNRQKELIEEFENKNKKLKSVEIENSEIKKLNIELENKYSELEKDLKNIKNEYEYKMKLIEDRVTNRELKNETRKLADIKTRFEIEIDNLRLEMKEKDNEITYLKDKHDILDKENNKLSTNKITAMETNEKIRVLQNENFIIHEKLNQIQNEKAKLEKENEKLEKQLELTQIDLMQKQMQIDEIKNQNVNFLSSNNKNNENNKNEISTSKNFISHPENFFKSDNSLLYYYNNNNIFEQIYQEREINTHDILIQSYLKEIQNLQNEIKLLKNINAVNKNTSTGFNFNHINDPSNNYFNADNSNLMNNDNNNYENVELTEMESQIEISQSNIVQANKQKENPSNVKKNNYLANNKTKSAKVLNTKNTATYKNKNNGFKNNSILKQCAEEKIKKLSMLLNQQKPFDSELENKVNYDGMKILTEEIKLRDKAKTGELDLETYLSILVETISIEMNKYELIEIFNNFYKYGPNKIKASDLINALVNNEPSAFFIQSDPGYLMQIEKKILDYEKLINEKQNAINDLNVRLNQYQEKFANIELENKEIKIKCENLEKEKQANQLVFNEIMKTNILRNSGANFANPETYYKNSANRFRDEEQNYKDNSNNISNKEMKGLKEKIKDLDDSYKISLKEFENKISDYESKLKGIKDLVENNSKEEIYKLKEINESLVKENNELKLKLYEIELENKNKHEKADEKIRKLKKNILGANEKIAKFEKEKEKLISLLNKKNINANFINNYLSAEDIEILEKKIADLEKKNKDREDHYKILCQTANTQQLNKEIENVTRKFDAERKELLRQLNQKNSELILFKKEFEIIFQELEELKISKKTR